ncbi:hypothetical protein ACWEO1_22695 [Kitasatospora cineracea]
MVAAAAPGLAAALWAEQADRGRADAELAGELFTADDEFPPGPGISARRRRGPTITLPDIATYQPQEAA